MKSKIVTLLSVFFTGFIVNILWEFLHAPLYAGGSYLQGGSVTYGTELTGPFLPILLWASVGDGLLILSIYGIVACIERDWMWVMRWRRRDPAIVIVLGLLFATYIEWRGLSEGRWGYGVWMPIVPILEIGLTPFIQLAATGLVTFRIIQKFYGGTHSDIS